MEFFRSGIQRFRESLFFLPLIVVVMFMLLAWGTYLIDQEADVLADVPFIAVVSVSGGRAIAAAVAGATITVAAIVFSITALTSQLAATQYSPRSVAGFFEDRFQQLVIGLVVGTFTYAVLVLAEFGGRLEGDGVQDSLSVTLVLILGVASVIAILAYLDHSLRRMRIGAVVRRIAQATVDAVRRQHQPADPSNDMQNREHPTGGSKQVRARRTGWVRAIDAEWFTRMLGRGCLVRIEVRVGEAVFPGDLLATVWVDDAEIRAIEENVRKGVHLGRERTLAGDPSYGIRQLVDIALRALSPGINDPTTAVDVLQHLKLPIREILERERPTQVFVGSQGQRVFLPEAPSRSDLVHAAFSEIRLAAAHQPAVLRSLLEILSELTAELDAISLESRAIPLRDEARLVIAAARAADFPDPDLERVLEAGRHLDVLDHEAGQGRSDRSH